jgi:hypothetical protein
VNISDHSIIAAQVRSVPQTGLSNIVGSKPTAAAIHRIFAQRWPGTTAQQSFT